MMESTFWVLGNLALAFTATTVTLFVIFYGAFTRWHARPGSRWVFLFCASLLGILFLNVSAVFIDGRVPWYEYDGLVASWRIGLRLFVYTLVGVASSGLFFAAIGRYRQKLAEQRLADNQKNRVEPFGFTYDPRIER